MEAEKRDPGNEVVTSPGLVHYDQNKQTNNIVNRSKRKYLILNGFVSFLNLFLQPVDIFLQRFDNSLQFVVLVLVALYLDFEVFNLFLQACKLNQFTGHTLNFDVMKGKLGFVG